MNVLTSREMNPLFSSKLNCTSLQKWDSCYRRGESSDDLHLEPISWGKRGMGMCLLIHINRMHIFIYIFAPSICENEGSLEKSLAMWRQSFPQHGMIRKEMLTNLSVPLLLLRARLIRE